MKILNFIKALVPRIEKNTLCEDLRVTISELENVVIPNYQSATEYLKSSKIKSDFNKGLSDVFYRNFDAQHGGKQSSFIADVNRRLPYIKENTEYILKQIEEIMERDIINEGLTARKAILVRAVECLSFVSRFSIDLLNVVYVKEALEVNAELQESLEMSPAVVKHVDSHIAKFATIISDYGIPNKDLSKIIMEIPEVIVNSKTANSIQGIYKEKDIDPFTASYISGFTYNPIYHIRLTIAEWQANRYKANKDKKKMLELRLLHLKLLNDKKADPKIEQELNYIQNRIDKIEHYLRDVEQDLGV